eukprot:TRINITY_DN6447_c0_g1_i1.p1 TRINITY_DN6447_c0_g1~~TRINITY_DN6447_c0_g1_i1.p1  ORF type:complete len:214 (+),score=57.45 TRINITY_DN6447_c0_g1_i1:468-1109(+)
MLSQWSTPGPATPSTAFHEDTLPSINMTQIEESLSDVLHQLDPFETSNFPIDAPLPSNSPKLENPLLSICEGEYSLQPVELIWRDLFDKLKIEEIDLELEMRHASNPSTAQSLSIVWFELCAFGATGALLNSALNVPHYDNDGTTQMGIDLDYFANVLSTMHVAVHPLFERTQFWFNQYQSKNGAKSPISPVSASIPALLDSKLAAIIQNLLK